MAHKAKRGGEIGANGEFYKGGQFVADTEDWVKGSAAFEAARKETVSVWGECHYMWTVETNWIGGKPQISFAAVGDFAHEKPQDGKEEENFHAFYGYMLTLYLADQAVRLPREDFWNCYAAAFGRDGIWIRNAKYRGKSVSSFVTLDDDGLAAKRKEMQTAAADIRWYSDLIAEREETRGRSIVSKHIGQVGQKLNLDVVVTEQIPFQSDFGGGRVIKFRYAEKNELVWITSKPFAVTTGEHLRIAFTVKGHDEYNGVPQTRIFRVKRAGK